jgi:hypothetical protein
MEKSNQIKYFEQFLNESTYNKKSILNLIFSKNEISELVRIKDEMVNNLAKGLDVDPFTSTDYDDLADFVKQTIQKKGIKIEDSEVKIVLELIDMNIII